MPPSSVRKCMEQVLGNLSKEELRMFINELVERGGEPRVTLSRVEGARHWEVVKVLQETFTERGAVPVAVELLREIGQNGKAEELIRLADPYLAPPPAPPLAAAAAAPPAEMHFVDQHQVALINALALIDPILDVLKHERVIDQEMYDQVRAETTPQRKARTLLKFLDGTGNAGKDVFLRILQEQQPFVYRNLVRNSD